MTALVMSLLEVISMLMGKLHKAETACAYLRKQVGQLKAEAAAFAVERDALITRCQELSVEAQNARSMDDGVRQLYRETSAALRMAHQELDWVRTDLGRANDKNVNLQNEIDGLKRQVCSLSNQLSQQIAVNNSITLKLEAATKGLAYLTGRIGRMSDVVMYIVKNTKAVECTDPWPDHEAIECIRMLRNVYPDMQLKSAKDIILAAIKHERDEENFYATYANKSEFGDMAFEDTIKEALK